MGHHKHDHIYSIDYYTYISGLKHINPSFKILFAIITLFLCIGLNNIYASIFITVSMGILTVYKGKISFHNYLSLLSIPLTFMILASLPIAIGVSKHSIGDYNINLGVFYIYLTKNSIYEMINLLLKALGAVSAVYMMTLSTSSTEIISSLRKIHVPKIIMELMNMIYRFIFIIMDVQVKMKNSAKSRLGYVDYKTSLKTFGSTLSNLFIVSIKKAATYYSAMEARCYDGEINFLEEEKTINKKYILYAATYFFIIFCIFYFAK